MGLWGWIFIGRAGYETCCQQAHNVLYSCVKYFSWDSEKNEKLKAERGISFEEVAFYIEKGQILDIVENPNSERYKGQRIFIIEVKDYAHLVPFVETEREIVLKTIIPSRKATRRYLRKEKGHG